MEEYRASDIVWTICGLWCLALHHVVDPFFFFETEIHESRGMAVLGALRIIEKMRKKTLSHLSRIELGSKY